MAWILFIWDVKINDSSALVLPVSAPHLTCSWTFLPTAKLVYDTLHSGKSQI